MYHLTLLIEKSRETEEKLLGSVLADSTVKLLAELNLLLALSLLALMGWPISHGNTPPLYQPDVI